MNRSFLFLSVVAFLAGGLSFAAVRPKTVDVPAGVIIDGHRYEGGSINAIIAQLETRIRENTSHSFVVVVDGVRYEVPVQELGVRFHVDVVRKELQTLQESHRSFWERLTLRKMARQGRILLFTPVSYNRSAMENFFAEIKKKVDRPAVPARLDLVKKEVVASSEGRLLDVAASIATIEKALLEGLFEVEPVIERIQPSLTTQDLAQLELTRVLGWYETSFDDYGRFAYRAHNLKLGASRITGTVILPNRDFSFNQVVGPRTTKEGYRMAPVISLGELVDDIGGGMCQIASTIFAAAFFAGLDVVESKGHSQVSHYIDLGLDATVVYPNVDMVLRNPYSFPVAIRMDVSRGRVRAEILGKEKPYAKIGFERRIVGEVPFQTIMRPDDQMLQGTYRLDQRGQKGYHVRRRRIFFDKEGVEVKSETWSLYYPPTAMIIREGKKQPADPNAIPPALLEPYKPAPDPVSFRREIQ